MVDAMGFRVIMQYNETTEQHAMFYRAVTDWASANYTVFAVSEAEMKAKYNDAYTALTSKDTITIASSGRDFFAKDLSNIQATMFFTRSKQRKAMTVPYTLVEA